MHKANRAMMRVKDLLVYDGSSRAWGAVKVILRLALGGVFVYAAYDKLLHPDQFAEILMDYEVLPWQAVNLAAIWLAMLELLIGLSVILGIWVRANALLMSVLMLVFIAGIATALARGGAVHCGCFSTDPSGQPRTWISLWQEILLLVGCILLWVSHWTGRKSARLRNVRPSRSRNATVT